MLLRHGDLAAWHLDADLDRELLGLTLAARISRKHDPAARNAIVDTLQLGRLVADGVVERVRRRDAVERDLDRYEHDVSGSPASSCVHRLRLWRPAFDPAQTELARLALKCQHEGAERLSCLCPTRGGVALRRRLCRRRARRLRLVHRSVPGPVRGEPLFLAGRLLQRDAGALRGRGRSGAAWPLAARGVAPARARAPARDIRAGMAVLSRRSVDRRRFRRVRPGRARRRRACLEVWAPGALFQAAAQLDVLLARLRVWIAAPTRPALAARIRGGSRRADVLIR